jgi:hypothetical protein
MWVSYMHICDRTGQGYAKYSSDNTATYMGKGCTGPSMGTSIVAWGGGKCTTGGVGQSICSDEAFADVMKHQTGVMSAVYSDQLCASTPSKFQLLTLGRCAKAPDRFNTYLLNPLLNATHT